MYQGTPTDGEDSVQLDLLVLTSLDQLHLMLKLLFTFNYKANLMWKLTVQILLLRCEFLVGTQGKLLACK
jgi:hypothetical protein